jgi:hypothetical protein
MGFGIALGMLLFGLVVGGAVLMAVGIANGAITWPFADKAQRFEGRGPAESVPLRLGGSIRIEWSASPITPAACRIGARLGAQQDPGVDLEIVTTLVDRQEAAGTPRTFELASRADYVLRVESDCLWSIRVVEE